MPKLAEPKTPRIRHNNDRLKRYKANRIKGMNQYNSAIAAGYSESMASKHPDRLEAAVKGGIQNALERAGLTDTYQAAKLASLTEATKVISCNIFVDKDGNMKEADGKSQDFVEVPDNAIQLKALEHIASLKKQTGSNVTNNVHIGDNKVMEINITMQTPPERLEAAGGVKEVTT